MKEEVQVEEGEGDLVGSRLEVREIKARIWLIPPIDRIVLTDTFATIIGARSAVADGGLFNPSLLFGCEELQTVAFFVV